MISLFIYVAPPAQTNKLGLDSFKYTNNNKQYNTFNSIQYFQTELIAHNN